MRQDLYVSQVSLKLELILPQSPELWNCRNIPPCLASSNIFIWSKSKGLLCIFPRVQCLQWHIIKSYLLLVELPWHFWEFSFLSFFRFFGTKGSNPWPTTCRAGSVPLNHIPSPCFGTSVKRQLITWTQHSIPFAHSTAYPFLHHYLTVLIIMTL